MHSMHNSPDLFLYSVDGYSLDRKFSLVVFGFLWHVIMSNSHIWIKSFGYIILKIAMNQTWVMEYNSLMKHNLPKDLDTSNSRPQDI